MKNEWGGIWGEETNPGFSFCEEYSVIFAVQRGKSGAGDGSHTEPWGDLEGPAAPTDFGVSWVALRLCLRSQLGHYFCLNLANLTRTQPPREHEGFVHISAPLFLSWGLQLCSFLPDQSFQPQVLRILMLSLLSAAHCLFPENNENHKSQK